MALTEQQKIDTRRFCGFPVYGAASGVSPPEFGYRYLEHYLQLEYRMNSLAPEEETLLINTYLANCNQLETAILTASDNLDTDRAAVWYHNQKEVSDRYGLFRLWCRRLIEFMGVIPPSGMMSQFSVIV